MGLPESNTLVGARELHVELIDVATREVWQSFAPLTKQWFFDLELEPGLAKIGIGRGAMDEHGFRRSPGADADGPLRSREFGGELFIHCARPAEGPFLPAGEGGPRQLLVDKHHTLVYHAGRSLDWLRLPDGTRYVHVVQAEADAPPLVLPDGWTLSSETLEQPLRIELPHPTTVFFFDNGDSYQGPIER